jgi:tetratricopeptide (TPR) repeat protein
VLVLAVIGFVGFSILPLISTAFKESQPSKLATPSSGQTPLSGQQSQLEEQARGYELVLQREPENQTALRGLVEARLKLRDFKGAIAPLEKLAQLNPNQTGLSLLLGEIYATQKRYDEAIAVYDQAIEADKQDFRPVLAKAIVLKQQGKTEQAKPLFENAAALAPAQYKDQINSAATEEPAANTSSPTPAPDSTTEVP